MSIGKILGWKVVGSLEHSLLVESPEGVEMSSQSMPRWERDLNACHEMENLVLQKSDGEPLPDTWDRYCDNLALLSGFPKTYLLVHSSAAQRSNAFLATMLP